MDTVSLPVQSAMLTANDGADLDRLGVAVAMSADGSTVVLGAPYHDADATADDNQGAAYVYVQPVTGWTSTDAFAAKLTAGDGEDGDNLGHDVAVTADGSTVVVSSLDNDAVRVYIRPASGWASANSCAARLTSSDGTAGDRFGSGVAVSEDGNTVVVGAQNQYAGGNNRGAAYLYCRPTGGWEDATETAKLTASDGEQTQLLGAYVATNADGGIVVVGDPANPAGGSVRGAIYVYARPSNGWVDANHASKLTASDSEDQDWLGSPVAVSGDGGTVVAGSSWNAAGGFLQGAAYVFARPASSWGDGTQAAKLTASDGWNSDYFGGGVGISSDGGTVVVGASYHPGGIRRGAAYLFARPASGWADATETSKLAADDGTAGDELGLRVAVNADGSTVAAGAFAYPGGKQRGAAYVFTLPTQLLVYLPQVLRAW